MATEFIKVNPQYDKHIALIELNRPKELNALNTQLMAEIRDTLKEFDNDDNIRVVILTGGERVFAAGADIKQMADATAISMLNIDQFSALPYLRSNQGVMTSIVESRLDELNVVRKVEMVAQSFVMAPFLLPGTRLVTIIQQRLANLLMDGARFRSLEPPFDLIGITEVMAWAPKQTGDAGHQWLRAQLRQVASEI